MRCSLDVYDLRQRIFLVKCFYQVFGDYESVKSCYVSTFCAPSYAMPTDEIVSEVIRLFEETGSVLNITDDEQHKRHEEIEFDEDLFDIGDSLAVDCAPGYDHQSFITLFDCHQRGVQHNSTDSIRVAVEKTLEDLEDPTKSLEASLSPLTSLQTPIASLEETIRELEESLRSIQCRPRKRHTEKKIICEVCGKGFANESRLQLHKTCHTVDKPHGCPECGKSFKWIFALSRHKKLHTTGGEKLFKCHMCEKAYRFERYLKLHKKNVHERQKKFLCKWCNQEFCSQAELLAHWRTHNQGVFISDTNPTFSRVVIANLQCSECGRIFSSKDSLRKHSVLHTEHYPFTCDICGRGFMWKEGVRRHIQQHIGAEDPKKQQCGICGKKLSRQTTLRAHLKTHERTQWAFRCTFEGCRGNFRTEKSLKRHLYERHRKLRIKCTHCDLIYKDKSQLQIHIRRCHLMEEAPFKCSMCQRFFWVKREFRKHMTKHHSVEI